MHILDELEARGFIKDITDPEGLRTRLSEGPVTFYCGFDPTNTSLTAGNLVPVMLMAHLQRAGHRPIVILGGGTGLVGDPSGKSQTREQVLTPEDVRANMESQRPQFGRFMTMDGVDEDEGSPARMMDNAEWLLPLHYLEVLRDIGRHFSVNEMLTADVYARRLENQAHLSFIEFNYRLVQAYDFLHLFRQEDCELQVGGSDQWGNCVAGTELIRKVTGGKAWVLTAPLLTTASGQKMGKTEKGAVWLDAGQTSPFDYFQYWMNVDDRDVDTFLKMFTFLSLEKIAEALAGSIQRAKALLAWEATCLCHGPEAASRSLVTAELLFGTERYFAFEDIVPAGTERPLPDLPRGEVSRSDLDEGVPLFKLFSHEGVGLAASGKQAKNLAAQGGAYVNGEVWKDPFAKVDASCLRADGTLLLRAGKKKYCLVVVV
ncbi:MAG: tyrosine--tRNA ligase [Myxococcota bacterium]|nr:tyrosine--tRNA ligase [Myxococcota bacterium]